MPDTPMDSGAATVTALPGVVIPFQLLMLSLSPPSPSGTIESRWPGRAAATATSTEIGPPSPKRFDNRNCAVRDDVWAGMPSSAQPEK